MKICLLAPANNPHTQKIAYSLQQRNYTVDICTFHNSQLSGINVRYFPPVINCLGKFNYILNSNTIRKYLKKTKPDILHAHYVSSYGVAGSLTGFHPLIISVWGKDIYDAPNNIFLRALIKRALANADAVLSTSKTMAIRTKRFLMNKQITVTPFGIDTSKFYPRVYCKIDKFAVGTARTLAPKYGIKYLIDAFAILLKATPNSELHIAGDGPQKNELINQCCDLGISDKVKFHGFINPTKMPEFLSKLSVFCMPSIEESESFGVASLEAQACGVPVIVSKIGGLPETVVANETGFLVPPGNSLAIAEKLIFLLRNKKILTYMASKCSYFVRKQYDWSRNIEVITKVYRDLIGSESVRAS